jgi:hypothetical protein
MKLLAAKEWNKVFYRRRAEVSDSSQSRVRELLEKQQTIFLYRR